MRLLLCLICLLPGLALASPRDSAPGRMCSSGRTGPVECIRSAHFAFDTCGQIAREARRHGLDPHFFARLIWQESRFDANALSPANAMGIAQFIRSTADRRGLRDPYNPADALAHSAHYLGELTRRYGNMGLAAVAYNGGERRADGLLTGGGLARETINYVRIITGLSAERWRDDPPDAHDMRLAPDKEFARACLDMAQTRRVTALAPPKPKLRKWGAQLAFGTSEAAARAKFKQVAANCASVRGERVDVLPITNRVRWRKGYYMVRISRNDRFSAAKVCKRARAQGCACVVYRNW